MKTVLYKWIQAIRQRWRCSDPLESRHTEDSASQLETHWSVDDKPNWCPILQGRSRYWQSSRGSASKQHRLAAERLNKRWGSGSRQASVDLPHVVTCWKDRVDHRNHRIAGPMKSIWNPLKRVWWFANTQKNTAESCWKHHPAAALSQHEQSAANSLQSNNWFFHTCDLLGARFCFERFQHQRNLRQGILSNFWDLPGLYNKLEKLEKYWCHCHDVSRSSSKFQYRGIPWPSVTVTSR